MTIWMRLPPTITAIYLPNDSAAMPADTWAVSWAEKRHDAQGQGPDEGADEQEEEVLETADDVQQGRLAVALRELCQCYAHGEAQ